MLVRRIARPLMSTIFIAGGIDALRNPVVKAQAATPLIEKSQEVLPDSVTANVPTDPDTLVKVNAAIQIGGGILLATGKAPRFASLALAVSLVPTTVVDHSFWNETDPAAKAVQRTQFIKNVSLLGGLLIAAVDTEGKPSLAWRGRRAARKAQHSVVAALPSSNDSADRLGVASDRIKEIASGAASRSADLAESAQPVLSRWADVAAEKGSEFAETAQPVVTRWADVAAEKGSEFADVAQPVLSRWAHKAADRGSDIAEIAQKRGSKLADEAADRGTELAKVAQKRGSKLIDKAADQTHDVSKRARKRADKQSVEFEKATEKARAKLEKKVSKARKDLNTQVNKYSN